MPTIKATVIVPTFMGEKKILTLMRALDAQTVLDFDCIIVVDGSTDDTVALLYATSTRFNKTIVEQKNLGRSISRNNGAKQTPNELLIFFDDDMEPQADSIEKHINFHRLNAGLLAGNQIDAFGKSSTDIQNYKSSLSIKWTEKYKASLNLLTAENLFFSSANCSIKRADFFALNGFDERLTDSEDYDLAVRAMETGMKIFFDKSNVAIHHDKISCTSYIKRLRQYQVAREKLSALHPERKQSAKQKKWSVKRVIYAIFAFSFWPHMIDRFNVLLVLPKFLRYKIYDTVIYSLGVEFPKVNLR